jgi:predicted alpha/beta superfamily hydrolase
MRRIGFALVALLTSQTSMTYGRLLEAQQISSRYLGSNRTIRVYLPPSYDQRPRRRYPVLYVHDGQNVFSSAGPNCCFGWGSWELDVTVSELVASGRMQEIIIVAIDNSRSRYQEYRGPAYPYTTAELKKLARKPPGAGDNTRFENYAAFLTKELKPKIDRDYRTLAAAAHTGVMGSSLGGICSLALAWEHPKTFGLAASLSGSFQIEKKHFLELLRSYQRKPKPVRIYLDSGTIDFIGDDDGRKNTEALAVELRRIGWKHGVNLKHFVDSKILSEAELEQSGLRRDKWDEAQSSQHDEFYWRLRAWRALVFLFPPIGR